MTFLRVELLRQGKVSRAPFEVVTPPAVRMLRLIFTFVLFSLCCAADARSARGQTPQSEIGGCKVSELQGATQEMLSKELEGKTERVMVLTGADALPVRVECDQTQFYAEYVEIFQDRNLVVATRNVLVVSTTNRISADRMEFDTKLKTGVFYNASGTASLGDRVDRSMFGTQEPDAMFRGKEIHKIGPQKYRIVDGAFSTCVQPTPRWEIVSGSATLNLDDYAFLKNSVFRVKGVPLMYLPMFYYPIQEDDRATGFLIPTYGTSTLRGQSLSNAFFWAINRSQDATLMHDWFSKAGQQYGGEYRYVVAPGSSGTIRTSLLDEKAQTPESGGAATPSQRGYRIDGGMTQNLGRGFRARANANYFSNASTEALYQQDVYRATQSTRSFGGNVTGNWREFMVSGTMDRIDYLNTSGESTSVTTSGGLPRINFSRGERPIGRAPLYFGLNSEYVTILRSTSLNDVTTDDRGLSKMEITPTLRVPFTRVPFFTVNSSVGWRGTYWSESQDPVTKAQLPEAIKRQYFDFNARMTGPVFMRIFSPPREGAMKFKHVIEPHFSIRRVTPFDVYQSIVQLEGSDYEFPDTTRLSYGLTNRLYAKKESAREVLNVSVSQSYYTDERAAQFDPQYQTGYTQRPASKYSAVALAVRGSPSNHLQTDFRTEWDHVTGTFQSMSANGLVNTSNVQASAGWSRQRILPTTPTQDATTSSHYLNSSVTVRGHRNRIGGTYALNYDLLHEHFLQQRYFAYYNAQCCGVLVEYQTFNFVGATVPQDRRFNVSFTLAGIGTFSNFLGAFGGALGSQTGR
jgi:LPS-assembly protein